MYRANHTHTHMKPTALVSTIDDSFDYERQQQTHTRHVYVHSCECLFELNAFLLNIPIVVKNTKAISAAVYYIK